MPGERAGRVVSRRSGGCGLGGLRHGAERLAPGVPPPAALPDRVQPSLEAEAQRVGLVVVGERASRLPSKVATQPHAGRVDLRAFTGDPDGSGILCCRRDGFADPREPVSNDQNLWMVLGWVT